MIKSREENLGAGKRYQRYRKAFQTECIVKAAANLAALGALAILIFAPIFRSDLAGSAEEAEIMKELGVDSRFGFSLFDEAENRLSNLGAGSSFTILYAIYQIFALVLIGAGIAFLALDCVKTVYRIFDSDSYALRAYDEIKSKRAGEKKKRRRFGVMIFFISGIVFEIIYILTSVLIPFGSSGGAGKGTSYFARLSGVSGAIAAVIVFALAAVGLYAYAVVLKNKIHTEISKEEYRFTPARRKGRE